MAKLLLIEPNRLLEQTYVQALRQNDHQVETFAMAQVAIEAMERYTPDLIIMELQLAEHDGIEFLHELRSYPEWQTIPVIVQTTLSPAVTKPLQEVLAHELGVVNCLYKPQTSLERLLRCVRDQVER